MNVPYEQFLIDPRGTDTGDWYANHLSHRDCEPGDAPASWRSVGEIDYGMNLADVMQLAEKHWSERHRKPERHANSPDLRCKE